MQQAKESGWYAKDDGSEVFIQKGTVLPDDHEHVKRVPELFAQIAGDSSPSRKAVKKVASDD